MGEMYTKDIVLEEVSLREFERMEEFWEKDRKKRGIPTFSKVINPITDTDYERLIHRLFDHPLIRVICFNEGGRWQRASPRRVTDAEIKEIAHIAANDRLKYNFLEARFKKEIDDYNAIIGFIEFQKEIIGYELVVPWEAKDLFTLRISEVRGMNFGLWVPDGYTNMYNPRVRSSRVKHFRQ